MKSEIIFAETLNTMIEEATRLAEYRATIEQDADDIAGAFSDSTLRAAAATAYCAKIGRDFPDCSTLRAAAVNRVRCLARRAALKIWKRVK